MQYLRTIFEGNHYDIVVCGGGPSGCTAALAARREGLNVLLIEGQSQLGGMATSGHVSHWLGGRTQDGHWVVGGLFQAITEEAVAMGYARIPTLLEGCRYQPHAWLPWFIHGIPLDPFKVAYYLDQKMLSDGVNVLYETQAVDVYVKDEHITHVIICNKSGIQAIPAEVIIDATGDADIASRSHCKVQAGRETDGLMSQGGLMVHLYNIDHDTLHRYIEGKQSPKFYEKISELRSAGIWRFPSDIFISVKLVQEDVAMMNMQQLPGLDGTDAQSRTEGLIRGRKAIFELLAILRQHFPGFENAEIKSIASLLGVRETRRIKSEFCLTVSDLTEGKQFSDTIGFSMYGWDLTDPVKTNLQPLADFSSGKYKDKIKTPLSTPIPYGIMVPRPIQNLLCPGRAVSVERDVLGPLRVMAPCMAMGEACGIASAQMVRHSLTAKTIDVSSLRQRLRDVGAIVDQDALPTILPRVDP